MTDQGPTSSHTGLAPNVASMLSYLCIFVTGIVFLILEKDDKNVRFHAWQSTLFGAAAVLVQIALSILGAMLGAISTLLGGLVNLMAPVVALIFFIFWIVCLIKAYNGERYHLPVLGDIAEAQAKK